MKRLLLVFLCSFSIPAMASHIVGGEFEIVHVSGNSYRINLILYFDILNGSPGARDGNFTANIYRKRDNAFMQSVNFQNPMETPVYYTQPECSNGEIVTSKLVYTRTITLSDNLYNDALGYYIIWERCCRNYTITNIYSQDPAISGLAAGQTFYLEFPPVVKNGQPFINSSPRLFPPLNDYACPRKPYYVDFAGIDDDGDSLVYALTTPLSTHSISAFPPLLPAPYPEVTWRSPFNLFNIIGGAPDLKISPDGFLTATPQQQGLFVFAVKCEEFRDGKKIGEVRRDFQMLVVDVCPRAEPPQILGRKLTDAAFTHDENMVVTFSNTVDDADRCIEVQVSDPDASKEDDNFVENVKIKAIPIGFKRDIHEVLPDITSATLINGSTKTFQICFDECPYLLGPFQVGIVAYDDACSLPLSDTLKITVNITPPDNTAPYFTTPDVVEVLNEGQSKSWPIIGLDDDMDRLFVGVIADGFRMEDYGMKIVQVESTPGKYEARLEWDTRCDVYDFTAKTQFDVTILVDDEDHCNFNNAALMKFHLQVVLPGNNDPVIDSDLTPDPFERTVLGITRKVNETLNFKVTGIDADNDFIVLSGRGVGFNMLDYNIVFPTSVSGNNKVIGNFQWDISCDVIDLSKKKEFAFQFIVVDDANKCQFYKADTLDVVVSLLPPDNTEPILVVNNLNQAVQMVNNEMTVELGQQITLGISGVDPDVSPQPNRLRLNLIGVEGSVPPEGYIFAPAEGLRSVETTFTWNPECSIFQDGVFENNYTFTFNLIDDACYSEKGDTVAVNITIRDVDDDEDFMPPNIITPNGDHLNEFFAMVRQDELTGALINILPRDNCTGHFEGISIFNRWGKQVYASIDRDFRWYADGESAGVYYYLLKFSDKEYKGVITVAFDESQSYR